jgi:hypothetical protein
MICGAKSYECPMFREMPRALVAVRGKGGLQMKRQKLTRLLSLTTSWGVPFLFVSPATPSRFMNCKGGVK